MCHSLQVDMIEQRNTRYARIWRGVGARIRVAYEAAGIPWRLYWGHLEDTVMS